MSRLLSKRFASYGAPGSVELFASIHDFLFFTCIIPEAGIPKVASGGSSPEDCQENARSPRRPFKPHLDPPDAHTSICLNVFLHLPSPTSLSLSLYLPLNSSLADSLIG